MLVLLAFWIFREVRELVIGSDLVDLGSYRFLIPTTLFIGFLWDILRHRWARRAMDEAGVSSVTAFALANGDKSAQQVGDCDA